MNNAVLISIQPKWCQLISSQIKTIEVRKTKPNLKPPFKVYIYCTANKNGVNDLLEIHGSDGKIRKANSKVIGEFICDEIIEAESGCYCKIPLKETQLDAYDLMMYADGKKVYGWHISNLIIYDEPKNLNEFYKECERPECDDCPYLHFENTADSYEGWCIFDEKCPIKRPPQSWCYVKGIK